jgi:sugar lactone lactonase YvrE
MRTHNLGQSSISGREAREFFSRSPFFYLLLMLVLLPIAHAQNTSAAPAATHSTAALAAQYGKLPLSFEANQGQTDPRVRFLSRGNGYSLFLTDREAVLALRKPDKNAPAANTSAGRSRSDAQSFRTDVVRMQLAGASPDLHVAGADKLTGVANYFIGNDPQKWRSSVPTYGRVEYSHVYPGIDLAYHGNQQQLEYDFIVAPHADPRAIRLHFAGAQKLQLTSGGDLEVIAKNGEIAFHKPVVYQEVNGTHLPVNARFTLLAADAAGFSIGKYDQSKPLVIDPTLSYSTYIGGSNGGSYGTAVAVDSSGDAYITGVVYAADFPATAGAYQTVSKGSATIFDAFVAKLNSTGTALAYATYLGGSGNVSVAGTANHGDYPTGITVDSSGNAYVSGIAYSVDFPVTSGAYQKTNQGGANGVSNGFITRINAAGSELVYSTYLGGSGLSGYTGMASLGDAGGDGCSSIAIDSSGDAYVTGTAYSTNFPVTSGAYQGSNKSASSGHPNAFVAKLNSQGSALDYATYLGGSTGDGGSGIAVDSAGDAYIDGATYSTDFPVTGSVLQSTNKTSASVGSNAFVTKLNSTGSSLVYSTYLGGSGNSNGPSSNNNGDLATSIAVDSSGDTFVYGLTSSEDFPVTSGAYQTVNNAFSGGHGSNFFVAKIDPTASSLDYATYLGGSYADLTPGAGALAVDLSGDAYITGYEIGSDFPVTANAIQPSPACAMLAVESISEYESPVLSEISPDGSALLYSTYFGGTGHATYITPLSTLSTCDEAYGLAMDSQSNAYLTGNAASSNFPTTPGAFQTTNPANGSAFVSKFLMNSTAATIATSTSVIPSGNPVTAGTSVTFTATVTPESGNGVPTGTITFTMDGVAETPITLNGSGQASYTTSTLAVGTHTITASYSGDINYNAGISGSLTETVNAASSTVASISVVSGSGQSAVVGSAFALPLAVLAEDANGNPVSGASVSFTGTGLSFANSTVATGSNGMASTPATPTTAGNLTAAATTAGVSSSATFALIGTSSAPPSGSGIISTYAGDGTKGFSGDGGPAIGAELAYPVGTAIDAAGNLYIADYTNNRIRKVTPEGVISTYAGNGTAGFSGDGGAATSAEINGPLGIGFDGAGNLYIGDSYNQRVREVTPEGVISTFAGNGAQGYNGDGIAATSSKLYYPAGIASDKNGDIFIADYFNNRVREVNTQGIISTVAGNGTSGYSGDGGLATDAELYFPTGVALDATGNLYIADYYNNRVREVTTGGIISTFAGNGAGGYSGDGAAATSAELHAPNAVATDSAGNVYIGDYANNRVRKVNTSGIISTAAGDGTAGYSGDGGLATSAELTNPQGVSVDADDSLYVADSNNNRIRKVQYQTAAPVFAPAAGTYTSAQSVTITDTTAGATIFYTTDDSTPTASSTAYTTPIAVSSTETLKAIATSSEYNDSSIASATYTINISSPSITAVSGSGQTAAYGSTFANPLVVIVKDSNGNPVSGAVVTFSGPGLSFSSNTATTGPNGEASVTAKAIAAGTLTAAASTTGVTGTASFSLSATQVALTVTATSITVPYGQPIPALTYAITGFVNGDTSSVVTGTPMEMTTATQGSAPGTYPITIAAGTLAAANYRFTFVNGTVTIASLGAAATPTFSPAAGSYTSAQSVTISDATAGATIYFTTDKTTPTTASTKFTTNVSVNASETIQAIAVAAGYSTSAVGSAAYTINLPSPSFTLSASPTSATLNPGQPATITLTISPQNGFNQAVTFSCSGQPNGDSCSFSPSTVTPAGSAVNSTLTISSSTAASLTLWKTAGGGLMIALLFWPFRRRRIVYGIAAALLLTIALATTGCILNKKPQQYTVTVTASGGSVTQTATISLTANK